MEVSESCQQHSSAEGAQEESLPEGSTASSLRPASLHPWLAQHMARPCAFMARGTGHKHTPIKACRADGIPHQAIRPASFSHPPYRTLRAAAGNSNESTKALFKERLKARTTPAFFFFRGGAVWGAWGLGVLRGLWALK